MSLNCFNNLIPSILACLFGLKGTIYIQVVFTELTKGKSTPNQLSGHNILEVP